MNKNLAFGLCVVSLVAALLACDAPTPTAPVAITQNATAVRVTATAPVPTSTPEPVATLTASDTLAAIGKKEFFSKITSSEVVTTGEFTTATITYDDAAEFDENSMVDTALRHMTHLVPAIFSGLPVEPDIVVLISTANFTDINGNTSAENAVEIKITKALNAKMNWPNFDRRNMLNVLDAQNDDSAVMVNPALVKAWIKSQNQ